MADFHETRMGHKFFEADVPRIADALQQIAKAMAPREGGVDIDGVMQVVLCAALEDAAKLYDEKAARFAEAGKHTVANANLATATEVRTLLKAFQQATKVTLT